MRCRECNVDLPKEYTACPLCGEKTTDDEPKLSGIRLAEYPKVETGKYKRNPFPFFIVIWILLSAAGFALFKNNIITDTLLASVICGIPLIWTLILRPVFIKHYYVGNYIIMNWYPISLLSIAFGLVYGNLYTSLVCYMPAGSLLVLLALMISVSAKPKDAKRAAPYAVLMGAFGIISCVIVSCVAKTFAYAWCAVVLVCIGMLVVLLCRNPHETKEELKAKFSIQ